MTDLHIKIEKTVQDELLPVTKELASGSNSEIEEMLMNYVVMRSVTIIETYFADIVAHVIDKNIGTPSQLFDSGELIDFNLEIQTMRSGETEGKIAASMFNFQNSRELDSVMSNILTYSFFDEIKKFWRTHLMRHAWDAQARTIEDLMLRDWDKYMKLFKIRNEITHSYHNRISFSKNEVLALGSFVSLFVGTSYHVINFYDHWIKTDKPSFVTQYRLGHTSFHLGGLQINYDDIYPLLADYLSQHPP